jgi:EmrB/QacA subfamily drug resistance transporter
MNSPQTQTFNRSLIIGVLIAGAFVTILNQTLLVIAIPSIMNDLHIDAAQAQWLTTAFLLTNGILIPISAFFIERFTSRALLIAALSIFTAGTLLGAVAHSFPLLLAARIIQAGGAGIMMPLGQTVLLTIFPPEKRGSAMGLFGLVIGFAPAIGPTLSGWIVDHFSWRYLFYIVLPIAAIVLLFAVLFMKNVTMQKNAKIDLLSVILSTLGWGGLLYGFSMVGSFGWVNLTVLSSLSVGFVSLCLFIMRQLSLKSPMLEFRVFRSGAFTLTTILAVLVFALLIGTQTILPIYAKYVIHISSFETGLILLPGAVITGIMSPVTGRIFDKIGGKELTIAGFALLLAAAVLLTNLQADSSAYYLCAAFALLSLGMSLSIMPLTTAGINALPPDLIAHGTAMSNTVRMVGASIGTALLVSVMSSVSAAPGAPGVGSLTALMNGIHSAFMVTVVMASVGLIMSFALKKKENRKQTVTS